MPHENAGLRISGEGYIQRTGVSTEQPVIGPLPMEYFGVSPKVNRTVVMDRRRTKRSKPLHALSDGAEPAGKLTILSVPKKALALVLLGTEAALSVTGSSATDEEHLYVADYGIQLAYQNVSSVVIESLSTGGTTYTVDVDYEIVDAVEGIIRPITGGAMGASGTCFVTYDYGSISGTEILLGTEAQLEAIVKMTGINDLANDAGTSGTDIRAIGYRMLLTPSGEINLAGNEPVMAEFEAIPLTDANEDFFSLQFPTYA